MYKQLRTPNLNHTGKPKLCLKFARECVKVSNKYLTAWNAWSASQRKHTEPLPNVMVPVWFTWTGTIDGVRKNYGDVAWYVPGRGVFGSPLSGGSGNRWDASVEERARVIGGGARYVGWTEDINDVLVVTREVPPAVTPKPPTGHRYAHTVGRRVVLVPKDGKWKFYKPGTDTVAKQFIGLNGESWKIIDTGSKPNRIVVNSAVSGGRAEVPLGNAAGKEYTGEFRII